MAGEGRGSGGAGTCAGHGGEGSQATRQISQGVQGDAGGPAASPPVSVRLGTFCEIGSRLLFKSQILQPVIGQILHFKTGTYRLLGLENFFAEKTFEPNLCQQKIYALESRGPYWERAPQWHV